MAYISVVSDFRLFSLVVELLKLNSFTKGNVFNPKARLLMLMRNVSIQIISSVIDHAEWKTSRFTN